MIRPISIAVATATPDADALVTQVNARLAAPWTSWDLRRGRTFNCDHESQVNVEAITRLFQAEGWTVTFTSDQRDGSFLRFTPGRLP